MLIQFTVEICGFGGGGGAVDPLSLSRIFELISMKG
jgi:hypothetical protein